MTKHGKTLKIPAVTGKTFDEAKKALESEGFSVLLQDSVYIDTVAPLKVIKQFPEGDELVKINRVVYLTVNRSVPPLIEMPDLLGKSLRIALMTLDQYGLKLGDTTFKNDFTNDAVLEATYEAKEIKAGTKISMGSKISLLISKGRGEEQMDVPDLIGMTYREAKALMEAKGLSFGVRQFAKNVKDSAAGYISKQRPEKLDEDKRVNQIRQGELIDVEITKERKEPSDDSNNNN